MSLSEQTPRRPRFLIRALPLIAAMGVAACTVGPDYVAPEPEMPDIWHQELTRGLAEGEANLQTWWTVFEDPILNALIERAAGGNLEVREAYARVFEARAVLGIAAGEFFPSVDAIGNYERSRVSEEIQPSMPGFERTSDFFQTGFDTSWEIDVFGRIRRSFESATAGLMASVEDYRDVRVVLFAEVASNYVQVRTLQERIRLALANVTAQRESLQLTQDLLDAGIANELDVRQAELNLASTEAFVPGLQILLSEAIHRLGVLLGEHPGALYDELSAPVAIPSPPTQVLVGLPTDLLRQRPDVRRAERELAAQTALVGVATADLYPRFSLVGTFTLEARDFGEMWDQRSRAFGFGPAIRWNLFQGGQIRNNIRAEDARTEQALVRYERSVLRALEEVENSMVGFTQEAVRRDALVRAVTATASSVELARTRFRTDVDSFLPVLDAQRALLLQQDDLAVSQGDIVQNLIRLYQAFGGGWAPESDGDEEDDAGESDPAGDDQAEETAETEAAGD